MAARAAARRLLPALALLAACTAAPAPGAPEAAPAAAPAAAPRREVPWAALAAAPRPPADARHAYGAGPLQFGELRLPPGGGRVPVAVLVHGGCWRSAFDVGHVAPAAAALTAAGLATWTLEYRRLGDDGGGFPGTFADVADGVDHLRALAARQPRLDTTRVVLVGHSAGGQLALWAAARRPGERLADALVGEAPLRVAGVVSLAGIADLAAYGAAAGSCNGAVAPLLGGTQAAQPARYAAVSPVARAPIGVPLALVHGALDAIVPVAQSETLAARERAAGGRAELVVADGAGHFDLVAPWSDAWPAVVRATRALAGLEQ